MNWFNCLAFRWSGNSHSWIEFGYRLKINSHFIFKVNINGLIGKLCDDLEGHYQVKLLNVSNGKFDGCYADRFKGVGKCKAGKLGFHVPEYEETKFLAAYVKNLGENQYRVPSYAGEDDYLVDMGCNICECEIGRDGSVCKHQYLLWSLKIACSTNFIPYVDASQRKLFAFIADGSDLPLNMYEGNAF